jgi:short-subunit dehydrogenase
MSRGRRLAIVTGSALLGLWLSARRGRPVSLDGAGVLITGASRGLGLLLAREFGRHGARVAICARDAAELERARADLARRGIQVLAVQCDVTDRGQVARLVQAVRDRWGAVDVLVNNAGVMTVGPFDTMTAEDYEKAMAVNFWGAVNTVLAVVPAMRERRAGRIVNIGSIGGKVSVPHLLPYSASKFAVVGFSEGLRAELAPYGIVVTTICPGLMRTGSPRNARFKGRHRAEYAWFSVSDALPFLSMDAERAARQIVEACRRGDVERVLSMPAQVASRVQGLAPALVGRLTTLANRLLPGPGGIGQASLKGHQSESRVAPSVLTRLGDAAAVRHNEMGGT